MVQEKQNQKKVDYSIMSDQSCSVCGHPLKANSANRGHKLCYVCFKLSQGKKTMTKNKVLPDGTRITIKTINLVDLQRFNIRKYKN